MKQIIYQRLKVFPHNRNNICNIVILAIKYLQEIYKAYKDKGA